MDDLSLDPGDETRLADESVLAAAPSPAPPPPAPSGSAFVYALGRVEPRTPSAAVEKEIAQIAGRADVAGLTDRQVVHALLQERQNRYLARQLAWVFTIEGLDTYLLVPQDPVDLDLLIESVRPAPRATDVDAVIGTLGPIAPPEMANGIEVPIVFFDQLYAFDIDSFLEALPRPKEAPKSFKAIAEETFSRLSQLADNVGATDEHRALNYLTLRCAGIYDLAARLSAEGAALDAVDVRPSRLAGVRNVVDVVFSYRDRQTNVISSHFVRVDVTEEFPFLVTPLTPYFDR